VMRPYVGSQRQDGGRTDVRGDERAVGIPDAVEAVLADAQRLNEGRS
jgi:hypothetical protein